jgi:hypothetical protein
MCIYGLLPCPDLLLIGRPDRKLASAHPRLDSIFHSRKLGFLVPPPALRWTLFKMVSVMRTKRRRRPANLHQDEDPLSKALAPPPDETEIEREARLAAEGEAQRRSDMIDEELSRQRVVERKTKCIRVLLLGESYAANENI